MPSAPFSAFRRRASLLALPLGIVAALAAFPGMARAHPNPDLPVRSHITPDGQFEVRLEVDPRSFEADPEAHDYLEKTAVDALPQERVRQLHAQADQFAAARLKFRFEPLGEVRPSFTWHWRKLGDTGPLEHPDDPAVLVGSWTSTLPSGLSGYRIEALPLAPGAGRPMNVVFLNFIDGVQVERYAQLFPGETSFLLDLTSLAAPSPASPSPGAVSAQASSSDWAALFLSEVKRGFLHVVPLGLDHILFVLGLFLLSRRWQPLLFQVSAFTVAHTLTLWLASAGWVNLSPKIVEPVIAASIVAVALENLFRREYHPSRLFLVFAFGLIHGLGFAGVMSTRLDSTASLVIGLLGVNIGVEFGQLAVIALAFLATFWVTNPEHYRKFVVAPASILISLAGAWWVAERTLW